MAKNITDVSLLDLLPSSISSDEQIRHVTSAIDPLLRQSAYDTKQFLINSRIDELPQDVLDLLAWQWHVDFYEPTDLSLEIRRKLIKESLGWHRIKGTPEAVRLLTQAVYKSTEVDEWYCYGGRPYYFRLTVNLTRADGIVDEISMTRLLKAVSISKNVRSWLDYLIFNLPSVEGAIYVGGGVHGSVDRIPIDEEADVIEFDDALINMGAANGLIVRLGIPETADEYTLLDSTINVGGSVGTTTKIPIPESPDTFDFADTVYLGGRSSAVTRMPVPETADDFNFTDSLRLGGKGGTIAKMPIPETDDVIEITRRVISGGAIGINSKLSIPEEKEELTMTVSVNAGGKYSLVSTVPVVDREV